MKTLSGYLIVLLGLILITSMVANSDPNTENWETIHSFSNGPLTFALKIKKAPNLSEKSWISIEVINETGEVLVIKNAHYKVELQSASENGKIVSEGYFQIADPAELFNLESAPTPVETFLLPKGVTAESDRITALCGTILGYTKEPLEIYGNFDFYLELEGNHRYVIAPETMEFSFFWEPMSASQEEAAVSDLNYLLRNPSGNSFEAHRLRDLLSISSIDKKINTEVLLTGLGLRRDKNAGRHVIAEFLDTHFAKSRMVKDYYAEHIAERDYRVLEDLKNSRELMIRNYVEPMVDWLQIANNSTKYHLLETLYEHRNAWPKSKDVSQTLSSIVLDNFGEILLTFPEEMNHSELVSWAAAAHMWSLTGDKNAMKDIQPFLSCEKTILGPDLMLDYNSFGLPRPNRVCDVALEAILRLQGADLEKAYESAGYRAPYHYGEGPIVIKRVRNELIQKLIQKKS